MNFVIVSSSLAFLFFFYFFYFPINCTKVCLKTGLFILAITVILFLAFDLDFSFILNLLVPSIFNLYFIYWCYIPSLYSVPVCWYDFPFSSSCISQLMSSINFCEWTNFLFVSIVFAHLSSLNSVLISLNVWTACSYWNSSSVYPVSNHPCEVNFWVMHFIHCLVLL